MDEYELMKEYLIKEKLISHYGRYNYSLKRADGTYQATREIMTTLNPWIIVLVNKELKEIKILSIPEKFSVEELMFEELHNEFRYYTLEVIEENGKLRSNRWYYDLDQFLIRKLNY